MKRGEQTDQSEDTSAYPGEGWLGTFASRVRESEDKMTEVTVSVPARPDFIHVLRSVIAAIAARADFTFDSIDDMRLAVDEASAQLLAFAAPASSLTLRIILSEEGGLEVVASTDADISTAVWPPEGAERTLTWQVLSALADEARFERLDSGPALRLWKRRAEASRA
jgi:serine/threonine-protein kinase RsbW